VQSLFDAKSWPAHRQIAALDAALTNRPEVVDTT